MQQKIMHFRRDDQGDWIVNLECGHSRHLRHDPPWSDMAWVNSSEARWDKIGQVLDCRDCAGEAALLGPQQDVSPGQALAASVAGRRDLRVATTIKAACMQALLTTLQQTLQGEIAPEEVLEQAQQAVGKIDVAKLIGKLSD